MSARTIQPSRTVQARHALALLQMLAPITRIAITVASHTPDDGGAASAYILLGAVSQRQGPPIAPVSRSVRRRIRAKVKASPADVGVDRRLACWLKAATKKTT